MGKYLSVLSFVPPLFIGWYRDCARESSLLDSSAIIGFQVDVLLQPFNLRVSEAGLYIIIVCVCVCARQLTKCTCIMCMNVCIPVLFCIS